MFDFDGSPLSPEGKDLVMERLLEYHSVFSKNALDIGKTSFVRHKIKLVDDIPFKMRSRPIPPADLDDA